MIATEKTAGSLVLSLMKAQEKTQKRLLVASIVSAVSSAIIAVAVIFGGYSYWRFTSAVNEIGNRPIKFDMPKLNSPKVDGIRPARKGA